MDPLQDTVMASLYTVTTTSSRSNPQTASLAGPPGNPRYVVPVLHCPPAEGANDALLDNASCTRVSAHGHYVYLFVSASSPFIPASPNAFLPCCFSCCLVHQNSVMPLVLLCSIVLRVSLRYHFRGQSGLRAACIHVPILYSVRSF